jgi:hypothetical protein
VAGVRRLASHPDSGQEVEFTLHPGWQHLLGTATEVLLRRMAADHPLWVRCEVGDPQRERWLRELAAEPQGEEVLMARSVWRRQEGHPARRAGVRIEAVLERLQPRQRPIPTPLGPRG